MAFTSIRRAPAALFAVCLAIACAGFVPDIMAHNGQPDVNSPDSLRQTIEQQVGKRVKLKLISGQDLEGQVAKVGSQAVSLTELAGMEFFDANVRLDQVAAVIVRRAK